MVGRLSYACGTVRTRSLTSRREALAFDADVKARKSKGEALPRPSRDTLADAHREWLRLRGAALAPSTRQVYEYAWNAHVKGTGFDGHRLAELVAEPVLVEELIAGMRERGIGPAAQRKVLVVLSAVLTAAVQWKKIPTNPVWRMPKPPATRQRVPPSRPCSSRRSSTASITGRPSGRSASHHPSTPASSASSATRASGRARLWH